MKFNDKYNRNENANLRDILLNGKNQSFDKRIKTFSRFMSQLKDKRQNLYMRQVLTPSDRQVEILDPFSKERKKMLMFGSNNYLGLANHSYIKEQIQRTISCYGAGVAGPPLLNGYNNLYSELEEKLAALKHSESSLLFSSGYSANVGLLSALLNKGDKIYYDELSHASFYDGLRMSRGTTQSFKHNNIKYLQKLLDQNRAPQNDTFVGIEGVYSMDGDLAPLDKIVAICKKRNSIVVLDDAHGTGIMGRSGSGTAEHFGVENEVDITMGTFSKTLAMTGGFVTGSRDVIEYLRYFARSHMFSAALAPIVVAAVIAGLKVIDDEPQRITKLRQNIKYTRDGLQRIGFNFSGSSPIIALRVPENMNIREAACHIHKAGIFINSIEYPAVPQNQQRFRISLMSSHTKEDINKLLSVLEEVWALYACEIELKAS